MDASENESLPRTPVALGVLTVIVYVAAFATVGAWLALVVLGEPRSAASARAEPYTCHVCGVVERVAESERASLQLSGDRSESLVVLIAALGGSLNDAGAAGRVYETVVLHDDGTVRVVRDTSAPQWMRGDRVRVVKGRVEPELAAGVTLPLASAAPDASQPGRTPSPGPQAARAW